LVPWQGDGSNARRASEYGPEERQHDRLRLRVINSVRRRLHVLEVSAAGELIHKVWFKAPYYCMPHELEGTTGCALLHIVPSIGSWERLRNVSHTSARYDATGVPGRRARHEGPTAKDIRWLTHDNCFASHVFRAFHEGHKIHCDTPNA
jgi:carotenoid cleavage dioxygenase-like enzyme